MRFSSAALERMKSPWNATLLRVRKGANEGGRGGGVPIHIVAMDHTRSEVWINDGDGTVGWFFGEEVGDYPLLGGCISTVGGFWNMTVGEGITMLTRWSMPPDRRYLPDSWKA